MSRHWMNPNLIYVSQNFRDNRFAVHFLSVFKCKCSWFFQKIILLARLYHLLIAGFKSSRASLLLTLRKRLKVPISLLLKFLTWVKMLVLGQALDLGHLIFFYKKLIGWCRDQHLKFLCFRLLYRILHDQQYTIQNVSWCSSILLLERQHRMIANMFSEFCMIRQSVYFCMKQCTVQNIARKL